MANEYSTGYFLTYEEWLVFALAHPDGYGYTEKEVLEMIAENEKKDQTE